MIRKLGAILLVAALVLTMGLVPAVAADNTPPEPPYWAEEVTLYAGQDIDVGSVYVWNDTEKLYVKYELDGEAIDEGWCITETKVHVGESLDDFPLTRQGNPQVGHFEYKEDHDPCVTEYTEVIPLGDWEWGSELLVAAHAAIEKSETLEVDSSVMAGKDSTLILAAGEKYTFEVSGTWTNRAGSTSEHYVDAKYVSLEDDWSDPLPGYPDRDTRLLELQVNQGFVDWGEFSPDHTYYLEFVGEGETVNFRVFDGNVETNTPISGWYGDNFGSLTVTIHRDETAWADGTRFVDRGNWATYFEYTVPFTPDWLDGMVLWLDASALELEDGDAVSLWPDMSPQGNDAEQHVETYEPTYVASEEAFGDQPVVQFDAASFLQAPDSPSLSVTPQITILAVARPRLADTGVRRIVSKGHTDWAEPYYMYTLWNYSSHIGFGVTIEGSRNWSHDDAGIEAGTSYIYGGCYDGEYRRTYMDGSMINEEALSGDMDTNAEPLYIGATQGPSSTYWDGDIAEILIYNRALSDAEREAVEAYLMAKYGL